MTDPEPGIPTGRPPTGSPTGQPDGQPDGQPGGDRPSPVRRGTLRVYLGAAPGVGKTYAMLAEGRRRAERGTDVVIGLVDTRGRAETDALAATLEPLPRRALPGAAGPGELDVEAALARHPSLLLVDELAHVNPPEAARARRWEDVELLLAAGIDVVSTVSVTELESLADVVESITGRREPHAIPDEVVRRADQIQLVDITPEALRRRLAHGNIYPAEQVDAATADLFRTGNLTALRELALLWLADRVDAALESYRARHEIAAPWPARERVVVGVKADDQAQMLIRRAARIARRAAGGELMVVHVASADRPAGEAARALAELRELTDSLSGSFHVVLGRDPASALLDFARGANASQLVLGMSRGWRELRPWRRPVSAGVVGDSGGIDVHLVSTRRPERARPVPERSAPLGPRRRLAGWLLALLGPGALTVALLPGRDGLTLSTHAMVFMALTVAVALIGGIGPALVAAVTASLELNWFFAPPFGTLSIADPQNAFALGVFVVVAAAVSSVVDLAARRSAQAARSGRESEALSRLASSVLRGEYAVDAVLRRLRETLEITSVTLLERTGGGWTVVDSSGDLPSTSPEDADELVPLTEGLVLALRGRPLPADGRRVLEAFAAHAAVVLERERLQARARQAAELAHGNAIRTALLAAVSHDLRTPLASIKAAASSLRQPDVQFAPEDEAELLATVEEGADRLQRLIENLLDVSRLQTGVVKPLVEEVALDEAVLRAIEGLPADRIRLEIDEALPLVVTDTGLLERILANLVQNAVRHSASALPVLVTASAHADEVQLRVIDRGRGVPDAAKERMFEAFQRGGDSVPRGGDGSAGAGVGLGLAVARGFAAALGGRLDAEDTPGGGLTMVLSLPTRFPGGGAA